jgi:hypothetical protein
VIRLAAALLILVAGSALAGPLPDRERTPGEANPDITQANINKNICNRTRKGHKGWSTKSIRPPASYTNKLKRQQMKDWGLPGKPGDFEEDHLISLQLGGHPRAPKNLWPEAYAGKCGARVKDRLENKLNTAVCAGKVTLDEARAMIATDWVAAYRQIIGPLDCGE